MTDTNPPRLPWEAHPERGFIAYPEGRAEKARYARLQPFTTGPQGSYSWAVRYDGQAIADISESKQGAANAATDAWPKVIEMAVQKKVRSAWEANQLDMIAAAERGEIEPDYFANEAAKYEDMMWLMDRIKPRPGSPGAVVGISDGVQRVVDALSAEFARRRR